MATDGGQRLGASSPGTVVRVAAFLTAKQTPEPGAMDNDDRVIRFPGAKSAAPPPPAPAAPAGLEQLSEDQRKAIGVIASGMTFVLVGIKPTSSGADFFTAAHGDDAALRNAAPHLPDVIENLLRRRGLV